MIGWLDILIRLGAATVIGGAVGLNRELHHKSTGVRTLGLVGLGSALLAAALVEFVDRRIAVGAALAGLVVAASLVSGLAMGLYYPAYSALVPALVPEGELLALLPPKGRASTKVSRALAAEREDRV